MMENKKAKQRRIKELRGRLIHLLLIFQHVFLFRVERFHQLKNEDDNKVRMMLLLVLAHQASKVQV